MFIVQEEITFFKNLHRLGIVYNRNYPIKVLLLVIKELLLAILKVLFEPQPHHRSKEILLTIMEMSDISKYLNDDTVFNAINKQFVSLQQKDIKECNIHVQKVVNELVKRMSNADTFFKTVYQRILFGGSFYKGTKVGFPEEFDLNIIIKLPINYNLIKVESCQPGFVKIYSGLKPNELTDDLKVHSDRSKTIYLN
ncbi:hypothetical protein KPH14_008336 [Odynerus spinipes]|uniref:Mab-21-like nucleotidyltransferase domain-containing protein n=1 Tax=Odynerus spinipes TaxID=1348599 RepID=A0AAD9R990_9HYME|nr:hypothetical protein KPH14_008336 [Odynerus spinipes]